MADIIDFPTTPTEHVVLSCPDCGNSQWIVDIHLMLICSECSCTCHALSSITEYLQVEYSELDFNDPA